MKDAKPLEQHARECADKAAELAQALLNAHTCERNGEGMLVLTMAMCMAGVAAGRAVEMDDERMLAVFKNAMERVKSVVVAPGKVADA